MKFISNRQADKACLFFCYPNKITVYDPTLPKKEQYPLVVIYISVCNISVNKLINFQKERFFMGWYGAYSSANEVIEEKERVRQKWFGNRRYQSNEDLWNYPFQRGRRNLRY
ncbi:hypothetical protein HMPREF1356_02015 [Enterococcus faecium C1904]|nr:hypothetical protein HMPREF1356_02015 [Enterococcus faecium C1904]